VFYIKNKIKLNPDSYYNSLLFIICTIQSITPGIIIALVFIVFFLYLSAIYSGAEVAFFSLSVPEINEIKEGKGKPGEVASNLIKAPERILATLLIAVNFSNIGVVILSTYVINSLFDFSLQPLLGFFINAILVTFFILLLAEILPKVYATCNTIKFAKKSAIYVLAAEKLFYLMSSLLILTTTLIDKRLAKKKQNISIDDLSHALELTYNEQTDEKEILEGIVNYGNKDVKEIMRPRIDVVAVDISSDCKQLIDVIVNSGYSRIPVYDESFDNIKGILYIKDLLPHINKNDKFNWQQLIRKPYFVPETKMINDLLQEFQQKKIHLAVVIDEYGGTSGIITLEDILEEIVGEINDEYDQDESNYIKIDDNNFVFEGKVLLNDFCKIIHCDDEEFNEVKGNADTLAGLILEMTGEIPQKNEKLVYKNYIFIITVVDARRIKKVKLTIKKSQNQTSR